MNDPVLPSWLFREGAARAQGGIPMETDLVSCLPSRVSRNFLALPGHIGFYGYFNGCYTWYCNVSDLWLL